VIRRAAARLVDARLEESRRGRGVGTVVCVLFALFCLLGVAAASAWWGLGAAVFVAAIVVLWLEPRRIERRRDELLAPERREAAARARAQWNGPGTGQPPSWPTSR
jgi:hypothetical protein